MVQSWSPLVVLGFDQFYVRFGSDNYDSGNLDNMFGHLTNFCLSLKNENSKDTFIYHNNTMFMDEFLEQLEAMGHPAVKLGQIMGKVKQISGLTLKSSSHLVENRQGSFDVLGLDFMLDSDLNVWLLEVNSSPSMDTQTTVTSKLVK